MNRLYRLLAPEKGALALAGACMAVLAVTTALAAALVGPALQGLLAPGGSGRQESFASWLPATFTARGLPAVILLVALAKGLAYYGQFRTMAQIGQRTASRLRRALMETLLGASPGWLGAQQTGELLARFTGDVAAVELGITYALAGYVRDSATAALLLAVCLWTDWRLTVLSLLALPLTLAPLARLLRRVRRSLRGAAQSHGQLGQVVAEGLQGLPSIQIDGLQAREMSRFAHALQRDLAHRLSAAGARAALSPVMELAAALGICAMLAIAAAEIADGRLSGERLASFLAAALLLAQPLKSLGKVAHFAAAGRAGLDRLDELFASLRSDRRPGAPLPARGAEGAELTLHAVSFRYGPTAPLALDRVTLSIAAGERVALVGASGSGKSTIFALVLGLREAQAGEVLLAGGRPGEEEGRVGQPKALAWVGQQSFLFDGTVAENVALGDPQPELARLRASLARAQALEFVERAGGLGAQVGERGRRFSGGERQRLCIARALYREARLLLLDEPTSQLDPDSEAALQRSLAELLRGRTSLVIAHRLSTVRDCSRVLVLHHGRIVEEGAPDELLARGGPFAQLFSPTPPAAECG